MGMEQYVFKGLNIGNYGQNRRIINVKILTCGPMTIFQILCDLNHLNITLYINKITNLTFWWTFFQAF